MRSWNWLALLLFACDPGETNTSSPSFGQYLYKRGDAGCVRTAESCAFPVR